MINPECPICFGIGWVCENHPNRAWDEQKGCQCGAGMPCECVRADGLEEPDISAVLMGSRLSSINPRRHRAGLPPLGYEQSQT